ncbi:tetratricopeptide repeat protein [Paraburkholderia bonniea]|uniref:tetratricopeptide repeat protein n=1 Tax=Paraburkholderia bonniea TaxID=2152891 RepID=UPI0012925117|nr:tetratricopeptide repeat protein [Paraburkholderia bonniea]
MKKFLAAILVVLLFASGSAFAVPTVAQIESAMQQGNWRQADAGLTEVLQAHPNNARAHYLYAQVLDREGRYADALAQVQRAKALDPQLRFTDPARFAQTENRLRRNAERAGVLSGNNTSTSNPFIQRVPPAATAAVPNRIAAAPVQASHGPSLASWIGIALLFGVIALVLRWTVRRARSRVDSRAGDDRRQQLKRATELLNAVRSLKLDVRLSSAPGHDGLKQEVEATETQLRELVEALSTGQNPVPPYQIDELEQQVERLKARADGRPEPVTTTGGNGAATGESIFAREAEAQFGRAPTPAANVPYPPYPPQPPQQQPPVVVQQGGGGNGGIGGLLTGVLLGQMLNNGGRERPIERDGSFGSGSGNNAAGGGDQGGLDLGQGSNDWNDGGSGQIDLGGNDDSGGWGNT